MKRFLLKRSPASPKDQPQPQDGNQSDSHQSSNHHPTSNNFSNGPALIRLNNVIKAYQTPVGEFIALRGINLTIGRGEFVAVVGKSGSGKSTLINMITGIDRPSSGEIFVDDTPIHNLAEGPMAEWRGRNTRTQHRHHLSVFSVATDALLY
jgi:ABC-type glutathione transport system ATPase component